MRYSLALANGCIAGPEDFVWVHANNPTFEAGLRDLAIAPYTFVILRCPQARLASAWLDKIVNKTVEAWNLRRIVGDDFELDDLTFRGFCDLLSDPKVRTSNIHWRKQVDFLVYEDYDGWFRLGDFAHAAAQIEARTGLHLHDARALSRHGRDRFEEEPGTNFTDCTVHELAALQRAGRAPAYTAFYDEDLRVKTASWYQEDLKLYGEKFGSAGLLFPDAETGSVRTT